MCLSRCLHVSPARHSLVPIRSRVPGAAAADVVLAGVDCDKALVVPLRHEDRLQSGSQVFLQAALLFTSPGGVRRVRVHTLALPVASSIGAIFRGADLETTVQVRCASSVTSSICLIEQAQKARCAFLAFGTWGMLLVHHAQELLQTRS